MKGLIAAKLVYGPAFDHDSWKLVPPLINAVGDVSRSRES
jgi:hypothetical protein